MWLSSFLQQALLLQKSPSSPLFRNLPAPLSPSQHPLLELIPDWQHVIFAEFAASLIALGWDWRTAPLMLSVPLLSTIPQHGRRRWMMVLYVCTTPASFSTTAPPYSRQFSCGYTHILLDKLYPCPHPVSTAPHQLWGPSNLLWWIHSVYVWVICIFMCPLQRSRCSRGTPLSWKAVSCPHHSKRATWALGSL